MSKIKYATISGSTFFWKKLVKEQIIKSENTEVIGIENETITLSSSCSDPLDDAIKLSLEHPDEVFTIDANSADVWNNQITRYEVNNGKAKKINERYQYTFGFPTALQCEIPYGDVFNKLSELILKHLDEPGKNPSITNGKESFSVTYSYKQDQDLNWASTAKFRYVNPNIRIEAEKEGLTFILLNFEILNENTYKDLIYQMEGRPDNSKENQDGYEPLPF